MPEIHSTDETTETPLPGSRENHSPDAKDLHSDPDMPDPAIIHHPDDLREFHGGTFVPTMGALHEGHLSLIQTASQHPGPVLASIFVNPTQFSPDEDFDAYPRGLDQDASLAAEAGCDAIYAPSPETIYPEGPEAAVAAAAAFPLPPAAIRPGLEDADRPHFFGGVCLIVQRLLQHARPARAIFGEKDWQQLQVIDAMVAADSELSDIAIIPAATMRDSDGLAKSSRNTRIPPSERDRALGLGRALQVAHAAQHPATAESMMRDTLEAHDLDIGYAVIRNPRTLLPVTDFTEPARALIAAVLRWDGGSVRLIDNRAMTVWR